MNDIRLCIAAFFRSKGKNVVTSDEFLMGISMNMRWMSYKDAERLLSFSAANGLVEIDGEYVRPLFDITSIDIPVGYRPSTDILASVPADAVPAEKAADMKTVDETAVAEQEDVLPKLIAKAVSMDIDRKDFMSYCRTIQKKMNIDIEVAAIMVLRDNGADVSDMIAPVRNAVKGR